MFDPNVPTCVIDLDRDEAARWADVIDHDAAVAGRLIAEAGREFERVPELLRWVFARLYQSAGGLYQGELQAWASALNLSLGTVTILNCAYELSHLRWPKLFGCTAGVRWVNDLGLVHVRNLDWPLATMGAATRLFRFRRGQREFVSVGVPGQVGVLSGMVPHAYSVTINWAPPVALPSFDYGPTFLLRDTLETCDTYDDAVRRLSDTRLSTSVFFTVCGVERDQACVIERTRDAAVLRPATAGVVVQANHHVAERFLRNNADLHHVQPGEEEFSLEGSGLRANTLTAALGALCLSCSLEESAAILDTPTVLNPLTCQQMVFCPRVGAVKVWHRSAA